MVERYAGLARTEPRGSQLTGLRALTAVLAVAVWLCGGSWAAAQTPVPKPAAPTKKATTPAQKAAPLKLAPPAGLIMETVDQVRTKTTIVQPDKILTQNLDTGFRKMSRVVSTGNEVRIGTRALQSVMKVNGKVKSRDVPGASKAVLRVYSPAGILLRTTSKRVKRKDLKELAVRLPKGEPKPGHSWRQRFQLYGQPKTPPIAVEAQFKVVGKRKFLDREVYEFSGTLTLPRQESKQKVLSASGSGKATVFVDVETGMIVARSLKFHVEQVREDAISQAYVKAGGKKLGYYVELQRQEKAKYVGTGTPPAFRPKPKKPAK
ncbi:MAG: hypothetical protein HY814_11720 [Candidatus Riflebacteria bacterium]|nr:hypothetical protein [Candidatus Riflebacteria bacterium]